VGFEWSGLISPVNLKKSLLSQAQRSCFSFDIP